jgi:hypothetical protein
MIVNSFGHGRSDVTHDEAGIRLENGILIVSFKPPAKARPLMGASITTTLFESTVARGSISPHPRASISSNPHHQLALGMPLTQNAQGLGNLLKGMDVLHHWLDLACFNQIFDER